MKFITKLLLLIILFISSLAIFNIAQANSSMLKIDNPFDTLNVRIPGMKRFSDTLITEGSGDAKLALNSNWIAEYVVGIYQYALSIIGILAAVTLMIGAVIWITSAGNPSRIGEAKAWISSSIIGLVLALGSYLILYTINPEFVILKTLQFNYIENTDPGDYKFTSLSEYKNSRSGNFTPGKPYKKNNYQIPCPKNSNSISDVANYYIDNQKITYSMDVSGNKTRGTCTGGDCFFDCSSFAQYLAMCTGKESIPGEGTTYNLFIQANNNRRPVDDINTIESKLSPGDLIGYNPNNGKPGHVMTYIGNNRLVEVGGNSKNSIIKRNGAIKIVDLKKRLATYKNIQLYYIKR